ncbi:PAS domain S-box protein [Bdellovibrio reynosensis]|uniref:histidine kinase n=1 Tax=Bdellovibrio reynosensis TaxID=2835041 RepID=A0ABY4CIP0_9BACT|nr:PAS domain S-box protein [Bdellovibrio reynosensis]UOF02095.1 PAS domain S-box protein [Bdellovibrio reynosensis]
MGQHRPDLHSNIPHSGRYSRLHSYSAHPRNAKIIRRNKDRILQDFIETSREVLPAAEGNSTVALIDSLPTLLEDIAKALERDITPESPEIYQDAKSHGKQRATLQNFTLDQVLHEYSILRRILFSVIDEDGGLDFETIAMILDCLQEGIEEAGREFLVASSKEHQRLTDEVELEKIRFQTVMSQLPAGVIFAEAPTGRIVFANEMTKKIFGREINLLNSLEEYKQREGWHLDGTPLQAHEWPLARAIKTGEVVEGELIKIQRHDGEYRILRLTANPIRNDAGTIVAGVVICEDMTDQLRFEEERNRSEEQFRTLLNKVPGIIWYMNKNIEIEYVSHQFEEFTGLSPEVAAFGDKFTKVIHPDDVDNSLDSIYDAKRKEADMGFYQRIKSRSGGWRWVLCRANPTFDDQGVLQGWIGKWTDIHEQKLTEEALKESESKFRELANALPMIIWTATPDGYVDWYNDWWYKYLGLPKGTKWDDLDLQPMHPEDVKKTKELWPESFKHGKPFNTEQRFRNGETGEYRWHLVRAVPVLDSQGNVLKYVGANTDIHIEKEHQEDAQFLLEIAQTFTESLDINTSLQTLAEKIISKVGTWCTAELFNGDNVLHPVGVAHKDRDKVDVVRRMRNEYPHTEGNPLCPTEVARSGKAQYKKSITEDELKKGVTDEKLHDYLEELNIRSLVCVPLTSDHEIIGAIMVVSEAEAISEHDKTLIEEVATRASVSIEKAKLYRELAEKNQELDRFAAIAAHDLKSPLISITQFSELLAEDFASKLGPEGEEYLDFIINAGNRMRILIDRLLEYARAGTEKKDFKKVSTEEAVATVRKNLLAQIEETGTRLSIDSELPEVFGDEIQIQQLFQNLIANAMKFHKPTQSPQINIEVTTKGEHWQFSIRDQGIGMEKKHLERIFEIFSRAHKGQYEGTGIGLAVCKRIVENHGGQIWAESELGKGTTFHFTIPKMNIEGVGSR